MEAAVTGITLRGFDDDLVRALKETSARRGLSVNRLILQTLRDALIGQGKKSLRYDDLDHLAGSWSAAEAGAFDQSLKTFEDIDAEPWRK
jgi:hypothetical protein